MKLMRLVRRFRAPLLWLCVLETGASSFSLAAPYFSKLFIDQAFLGRDIGRFFSIASWGAVSFAFALGMYCLNSVLQQRLRIRLPLALKNVFLRRLFALDLQRLQDQAVGERVQRLLEIESFCGFVIDEVPNLVAGAVVFVCSLTVAFFIDARMTAVAALLSPLFLLRSVFFQKKIRSVYEAIWAANAGIAAKAHESFDRILFVKAYALEVFQRRQIMRRVIAYLRSKTLAFRWELFSYLSLSFLSKAVYGTVMLYGGWLIISGRTTLGNYSAVMLYLAAVGSFAENFGARIENFAQQRVALGHFFEIVGACPEPGPANGACAPAPAKGAISFSAVSFAYPGREEIFSDVTFDLPAGGWTGISGPSGSGKTTLASLCVRLYDRYRGTILIDGVDIRNYDLRTLRRSVCLVTQQPALFDLSVRDNLVCDLKHVSQSRLEEACRAACIHDEIERLPSGYDTLIGEDACRLSQGQKQRLCIARALLRDPLILILDEATSSLHAAMEEELFKLLRASRDGRTTIVVSHRMVPLLRADSVLTFHPGGNIVLEART